MKRLLVILLLISLHSISSQTLVEKWGSTGQGNAWAILNDSSTVPGNASMGGYGQPDSWATIRGSFGQAINISADSAFIISGLLEYVGGGAGLSYLPLRYALTYQKDEGSLVDEFTDSASWSVNGGHYGYEFTPPSGTTIPLSGAGGAGTVWTIVDGNWNSTYSNNGEPISNSKQSPRNAEIIEGLYEWAISIQPLDSSTNEVRWYLQHKELTNYWFGGIALDTAQVSKNFNGICFAIGNDIVTNLSRFNLFEVKYEFGSPISTYVPEPGYYIDRWGIIGDRFSGWTTIPGELVGNFSVYGNSPNTGLVTIRGEFPLELSLSNNDAIKIEGKVILEGGRIVAENSIRFGIFNSEDAGNLVDSPIDSMRWSGSEDKHSGYLIIPPCPGWDPAFIDSSGNYGNWGAVINNIWYESNLDGNYSFANSFINPQEGILKEWTYNFEISISLQENNSREIRYKFICDDQSYGFAGSAVDENANTDLEKFNCVSFALDAGNMINGLHLRDVRVEKGEPVILPDWVTTVEDFKNEIPSSISLKQNYPNPFNSLTKIQFIINQKGFVSLKTYDILGGEVKTLINKEMNAGAHSIDFSGHNLSSGIYYYKLQSNNKSQIHKMVLLK